MPVEFLTDDEAAAYGRRAGPPSQADLDRVFFLDDDDLEPVGRASRGAHEGRLRAAADHGAVARDVPAGPAGRAGRGAGLHRRAVGHGRPVAGEAVHRAGEDAVRPWEIRRARGYREFADAEAEFSGWVAARSRATGNGPKAIFADGLAWLRERKVLLPGVTTPIGVFSLETRGYRQSYK